MKATINAMPKEELNITFNQIAKKYRSLDYVRHVYRESFGDNFKVNYDYVEGGIEKTKTFKKIYRMYCINLSKLAVEMYISELIPETLRLEIHSDYTLIPEVYDNFKKFMRVTNPCMSDKDFSAMLKDVKSAPLRETFVEFLELVKEHLMASGASFYALAYLNRIKKEGNRPIDRKLYVYYRDKVKEAVNKVETSLLKEINLC